MQINNWSPTWSAKENVNYNPGSIISANTYRYDYLMNGLCFRWGFIRRGATRLITGHACSSSWPSTKIYRTCERIRCRGERSRHFKDDNKFMSMNIAIENVCVGTLLRYQFYMSRMQKYALFLIPLTRIAS